MFLPPPHSQPSVYLPSCRIYLVRYSQSVVCWYVLIYHSPPYLPCSIFSSLLFATTPLVYLVQYFPVCDLQLRSYLPSCPFTSPLFTLNNISQSVICCHVLIYHPVQSPLFTFLSFVVTFLFTLSPSTSILATGRRRRQTKSSFTVLESRFLKENQ